MTISTASKTLMAVGLYIGTMAGVFNFERPAADLEHSGRLFLSFLLASLAILCVVKIVRTKIDGVSPFFRGLLGLILFAAIVPPVTMVALVAYHSQWSALAKIASCALVGLMPALGIELFCQWTGRSPTTLYWLLFHRVLLPLGVLASLYDMYREGFKPSNIWMALILAGSWGSRDKSAH